MEGPEYTPVLSSPKKAFESVSPLAISSSAASLGSNIDATSSSTTSEYMKFSIPEYTKVLDAMFVYIDKLSDHQNPHGTKDAYTEGSSRGLSILAMGEIIETVLKSSEIPSDADSWKV